MVGRTAVEAGAPRRRSSALRQVAWTGSRRENLLDLMLAFFGLFMLYSMLSLASAAIDSGASSKGKSTTSDSNNSTMLSCITEPDGTVSCNVQGENDRFVGTNADVSQNQTSGIVVDPQYPGTAVQRLRSVHLRVAQLSLQDLSGDWEDVRRKILWAGGLKDLPNARPGKGYTGHSFNDFNHVDLTTMLDQVSDNRNEGQVEGIAYGNHLGPGIRQASIPDLGPGGSWSTCAIGCQKDPPEDVAHLQFKSRIAFKLVWVPPTFTQFMLVDDGGKLLATGRPKGSLPAFRERQMNYDIVKGSKYAREADQMAASVL